MIIGIMQPYYLPYMGYFQLMRAVDTFVYYDDVTFIKQGWINRNNISLDGKDYRFTLELQGVSSFKNINEIKVGNNREKLYKTFVQAYSKSPYFNQVADLLWWVFHSPETNLLNYITHTHCEIFYYLNLNINYLVSSEIQKDCSLKGKDKVIDICKRRGADTYINAIGGQHLYDRQEFKENGIDLFFIHPSEDLPKRSILDVMMYYSPEEIRTMLNKYELI
jgi:hypothetical protein